MSNPNQGGKRCLRLLRWYGDNMDLGDYLIALGNAVKAGDADMIVNHGRDTVDIDFNWGGDSGP